MTGGHLGSKSGEANGTVFYRRADWLDLIAWVSIWSAPNFHGRDDLDVVHWVGRRWFVSTPAATRPRLWRPFSSSAGLSSSCRFFLFLRMLPCFWWPIWPGCELGDVGKQRVLVCRLSSFLRRRSLAAALPLVTVFPLSTLSLSLPATLLSLLFSPPAVVSLAFPPGRPRRSGASGRGMEAILEFFL
mmetsp:Transcript_51486/g.134486  ORF Transcript_51486/g.134486 Transcript_51486/m.134486 type:complete len:187 (-) Transcript_51486:39-599(-)